MQYARFTRPSPQSLVFTSMTQCASVMMHDLRGLLVSGEALWLKGEQRGMPRRIQHRLSQKDPVQQNRYGGLMPFCQRCRYGRRISRWNPEQCVCRVCLAKEKAWALDYGWNNKDLERVAQYILTDVWNNVENLKKLDEALRRERPFWHGYPLEEGSVDPKPCVRRQEWQVERERVLSAAFVEKWQARLPLMQSTPADDQDPSLSGSSEISSDWDEYNYRFDGPKDVMQCNWNSRKCRRYAEYIVEDAADYVDRIKRVDDEVFTESSESPSMCLSASGVSGVTRENLSRRFPSTEADDEACEEDEGIPQTSGVLRQEDSAKPPDHSAVNSAAFSINSGREPVKRRTIKELQEVLRKQHLSERKVYDAAPASTAEAPGAAAEDPAVQMVDCRKKRRKQDESEEARKEIQGLISTL